MDKTDVELIQLLLANSRLSYGKLAEKLGLSVNAVHKRIQTLIDEGVIRKFTARLSRLAVNSITICVYGTSDLDSFKDLPEKMKTLGSIYWLALGGGKYLYIGAYLPKLDAMEQTVSFIKKEAKMVNPAVGILGFQSASHLKNNPKELELCELDFKIVYSLKDNSRKAISDVADEVGISSKTVRRRLSRMLNNGLIELSLELYPDASNDVITLLEVKLKTDRNNNIVFDIFKKYSPNIMFFWSFINLTDTVIYAVWTNTMKQLQAIRETLEKQEGVSSVNPNILYVGYLFNTWRDEIDKKSPFHQPIRR